MSQPRGPRSRRKQQPDLSPKLVGKRVLVTGTDSRLGAAVAEQLRKAGARVVATRSVEDDAWEASFLDVSSFDAVLKAVAFHDVDAIVHTTNMGMDEGSIYAAATMIVQGTRNIVSMGKPVVAVSDYISVEQGGDVDLCMTVAERMVTDAGGEVVIPATGWLEKERAMVGVEALEQLL